MIFKYLFLTLLWKINKAALACNDECQTCYVHSANCFSCKPGFNLVIGNSCNNPACASTFCTECSPYSCSKCKWNYYPSSNTCYQCPKNCVKCNGIYSCSSCYSSSTLINNRCCTTKNKCAACALDGTCTKCAEGRYLSNGVCYDCLSSCKSCIGNSYTCK